MKREKEAKEYKEKLKDSIDRVKKAQKEFSKYTQTKFQVPDTKLKTPLWGVVLLHFLFS